MSLKSPCLCRKEIRSSGNYLTPHFESFIIVSHITFQWGRHLSNLQPETLINTILLNHLLQHLRGHSPFMSMLSSNWGVIVLWCEVNLIFIPIILTLFFPYEFNTNISANSNMCTCILLHNALSTCFLFPLI